MSTGKPEEKEVLNNIDIGLPEEEKAVDMEKLSDVQLNEVSGGIPRG